MKKMDSYTIASNREIAKDIYRMTLYGDTSAIKNPGEFVNVSIPGKFLARPISVSYFDQTGFILIYKVVGEGTEILSNMHADEKLNILTGLGNGFDVNNASTKPLLIGGGMGVAPLYQLAYELKKRNKNVKIIIGFKSQEDIILYEKFKNDFETQLALENSLNPQKRLVTDILKQMPPESYDYFYACGPKPMLKAICDATSIDGELSLESRMACGVGQCKCCSIETNDGMKTLCKDGPVLKRNLVRW